MIASQTTECSCKHIVSVSLGSSERNAKSTLQLKGQTFIIERLGTDGNLQKARQLLEKLDGRVDALGLGGTDLYVYAGGRRYTFRESAKLIENVKKTPVLDGSGLKNSLERILINRLAADKIIDFQGKKVLMVCGVDRFGMAEALVANGADVTFGDLIFGLNWEHPIKSLQTLDSFAKLLAPLLTKLPVRWFYPMGAKQSERKPQHQGYFLENDIIAGDFHFIRRFMPDKLTGKTIITNTVTAGDRKLLRNAGVRCLITTTPSLDGRSYGTNVMEGLLVAASGADKQLDEAAYEKLLEEYKIESGLEYLNGEEEHI